MTAPVETTTDALQLFLREAGRHQLLTAAQEVELAKRDRARRHGGEGADDPVEPPPRRLDREELPQPGPPVPRPDPGGHARPDPRGREVRLAPRLQVLDLRDRGGSARRSRARSPTRPGRSACRCTSSSGCRRSTAPTAQLWTQLGREPSLDEIADEASLTVQQVLEVRAAARASTSLDAPVGDGEDAVVRRLRRRRRAASRGDRRAQPAQRGRSPRARVAPRARARGRRDALRARRAPSRRRSRRSAAGSVSRASACGRSSSSRCADSRIPARDAVGRRDLARLRAQVELEARRDRAELAERTRLELAHALARDPEVAPDLLERPRADAVEAEALDDDAALARLELLERVEELGRTCAISGLDLRAAVRSCPGSGRRRSSRRLRSASRG